jgi:hypothetical protein
VWRLELGGIVMNVGLLRLGFAAFWLVVAVAIYFRDQLAPGAWAKSHNVDLGIPLALALAVWNVVRWYIGRRKVSATSISAHRGQPLEPRDNERVMEYNPDFDFNNPSSEGRP